MAFPTPEAGRRILAGLRHRHGDHPPSASKKPAKNVRRRIQILFMTVVVDHRAAAPMWRPEVIGNRRKPVRKMHRQAIDPCRTRKPLILRNAFDAWLRSRQVARSESRYAERRLGERLHDRVRDSRPNLTGAPLSSTDPRCQGD